MQIFLVYYHEAAILSRSNFKYGLVKLGYLSLFCKLHIISEAKNKQFNV